MGDEFAGYRLDGVLGRNAAGVVFHATHLRVGAPVALSIFPAEPADDAEFRRRFDDRARVAASLVHPHIVPVYDAGEADGLLYLAMRRVSGSDLGALVLANGPLTPSRALALLRQVASALTMMHSRGLAHRNVHPGNVLVCPSTGPGVAEHAFLVPDLGLARATEADLTRRLTGGMLAYTAPELLAPGARPDAGSDLYALACVACTCLAGGPPFGVDPDEALIAAHLHAPPPRVATPDGRVPPAVDDVLARALAKNPRDRQPSCTALVAELHAACTAPARPAGPTRVPGPPGPSRRLRWYRLAAVAALLVVAVVATALVVLNRAPSEPLADDIRAIALSPRGDLYLASLTDDSVQVVRPNGTISTVAGGNGEGFAGDGGPATEAMLADPAGLAVGADGGVYVADNANNRVRRIAPDGTISTVAGNGTRGALGDGGQGVVAQLNSPLGVDVDAAGTLLIADAGNRRVRAIDREGRIRTVAGGGESGNDGDGGPATAARLSVAYAIAADPAGGFYVADRDSGVVRRVAPDGRIGRVAGGGTETVEGRGPLETSLDPTGLAVGPDGVLYISEAGKDRVVRVEAGPSGPVVRTVLGIGAPGYAPDGSRAAAVPTALPGSIEVDPDGTVYVAEVQNGRIRSIDESGTLGTVAGDGPTYPRDGEAGRSFLRGPADLAIDRQGRVYIAEYGAHRVRRLDPDGTITTVAGTGRPGYGGDGGPAVQALLNGPLAVAVEPDGSLLVAEVHNDSLRRIAPDGTITTLGGAGRTGSLIDGLPLSATPVGNVDDVAVGPDGTIYLAEAVAHTVHRVGADGVVRRLAGTGVAGTSGDGGPATAATLNMPDNLSLQVDGSLVVACTGDGTVRRIDPSGTITTVAGTGTRGSSGDGGPARAAQLDGPYSLTGDAMSNLYVGDGRAHVIRRIDPGGTISTIAGDGSRGASGDGGPAVAGGIGAPNGLVVLADGALLAADYSNDRIIRVAVGVVTTVAGHGSDS